MERHFITKSAHSYSIRDIFVAKIEFSSIVGIHIEHNWFLIVLNTSIHQLARFLFPENYFPWKITLHISDVENVFQLNKIPRNHYLVLFSAEYICSRFMLRCLMVLL